VIDDPVLDQITPLILTFDEAPNIRRTLAKLAWARRIVVVDSGSSDGTLQLLADWPQVEVVYKPFSDFAGQTNFGLSQVRSPWVLSLDADYELSDELVAELASLAPSDDVAGYRARFVYRVFGSALRASLYPPRTVLYRRDRASYRNEGHGHRVAVDGPVLPLRGVIYHDDRKPLSRWIAAQRRYAREEANYLARREGLSVADRVRRTGWAGPIAVFLYTLFVKGCLFDGWPGWYYALQRLFAETLLALEILDRRLRERA